MAKKQSLKAAVRTVTGTGKLNRVRREGWLPSVIYGQGAGNQNLQVDAKAFKEMLASSVSENIIVNLDIDGAGTRMAFLQAVHHDPLSGNAVHADFRAISENTEITAHIPVRTVGEAAGVKAGGLLEIYLHSMEIICLPNDLPDEIVVDVSALNMGDSLHISEIKFPAGVKPTHAGEVAIAHIGHQGSGDEAAEGDAATAAAAN